MSKPVRVILCWMSAGDTINSIAYGRPRCITRVYEKDKYDPRVGEDLPFFDDPSKAFVYMRENMGMGGVCQVEVGGATRVLGFADKDLDIPVGVDGCCIPEDDT